MDQERVEAWFAGELPDYELTEDEIEWLEDAVREAVMRQVTAPRH